MPIQQITSRISKPELLHLYNEAVAFVAEIEEKNRCLVEANEELVRSREAEPAADDNMIRNAQLGLDLQSNLQVLDNIKVDNATLTLENGVKLNVQNASLKSIIRLARTGLGIEGDLMATSSYDLILAAVGPQKIQCIKIIRALTSLGLRDAKRLVDSVQNNGLPYAVLRGCSFDVGIDAVEKLTGIGAVAGCHPSGSSPIEFYRDLEQEYNREQAERNQRQVDAPF